MDQGIVAISVVTTTNTRFAETGAPVEGAGRIVGGCHLEGGVLGAGGAGLLEQALQHPAAQPPATATRIDRHQGDVQLLEDQPAAGHGHQRLPLPQAHPRAARGGQFRVPLAGGPKSPQGTGIEGQAGLPVGGRQGPQRIAERIG